MAVREDFKIEICANSVMSCIAAQTGGADRVELCAGIPEGGTTPSAGTIKEARESLQIGLGVIIRPRGGDFLYSRSEVRQMLYDIELARSLGADTLVFGALTPFGKVDMAAMRALMQAAGSTPVTFHRAFDHIPDKQEALEQIIDLGCSRILTSGGAKTALQGVQTIAQIVEKAAGRIAIMPGCGVNEDNIALIARQSGAREFHFSARETLPSAMVVPPPPGVLMGTQDECFPVTTAARVKETITNLITLF